MTYLPCILMPNPLAFKLAFHEEQIYRCLFGNIKYDATISKIELSSVFFWGTFTDLHSVFKIPLSILATQTACCRCASFC